ncbi:MAG: YybH family protein [Betaproteobacteria bacterium]
MIAILIPMLLAAAPVAVPQETGVPADARATIAAANAGWVKALEAGTPDTTAEPYAADGIFVTATGTVITGRDAIAKLMRDRLAQTGKATSARLVQDGLTRQGALIYEWGHAVLEFAREGSAPVHSGGRYLTVWQMGAAGRWEIIRNLSLPE